MLPHRCYRSFSIDSPSIFLFFIVKYMPEARTLLLLLPSRYLTCVVQITTRRSGRSRTPKDPDKLPIGTGKTARDHAYWERLRTKEWPLLSEEERDEKMEETKAERDAAREVFEAEQMEKEDELSEHASPSPAPTAEQVIRYW